MQLLSTIPGSYNLNVYQVPKYTHTHYTVSIIDLQTRTQINRRNPEKNKI